MENARAKRPFFSVVIPLYNKAPHVARAIKSVLNQSFGAFELIVVNDASTDGSDKEVMYFSDSRIKLLHRDSPGPGGYAARNLGIIEASAEWVAFLDADDEWMPEHLMKMQKLTEIFQDVHFLACGWCTQGDGSSMKEDAYYNSTKNFGVHQLNVKDYLKLCLANSRPVCSSIVCIKKNSNVALGLFPEDKKARRGGDLHAWLKMICHHKKMAWSNHVGAIYFRDSQNMVTKTAPSSPWLMGRDIYQELSANLSDSEKELLKKYLNIRLKKAWVNNLRNNNENFNLTSRLYWKGDLLNALKLAFVAILPTSILKSVLSFKSWIRSNES